MAQHPVQPLVEDEHGVHRFKRNEIVIFLLKNSGYDWNKLAVMKFSDEDREQFAELTGYSLSGFGDLSYVSDETFERASNQEVEHYVPLTPLTPSTASMMPPAPLAPPEVE